MTRDDVWVAFENPCPCGAGRVEIVITRADHAYAKADASGSLTCAVCSAFYSVSVDYYGQVLTLYETSAVNERGRIRDQISALTTRLHDEVCGPIAEEVARRVRASGHTFKKWAVVLDELMPQPGRTIEALRKDARNCGGIDGWVRHYVRENNVAGLCDRLAMTALPIGAIASELRSLRKKLDGVQGKEVVYRRPALRLPV